MRAVDQTLQVFFDTAEVHGYIVPYTSTYYILSMSLNIVSSSEKTFELGMMIAFERAFCATHFAVYGEGVFSELVLFAHEPDSSIWANAQALKTPLDVDAATQYAWDWVVATFNDASAAQKKHAPYFIINCDDAPPYIDVIVRVLPRWEIKR